MRISIFIQKIDAFVRRLWSIPFLRFLVVGGINTIFSYTVFAISIFLQFPYTVAALLSNIFGSLFSFKTHGIVTFRNKSNRLVFRFSGVAIFMYLLNIGLLKIFEICNISSLVAQAILILPLAFTSFLLMRRFVFKTNIKP